MRTTLCLTTIAIAILCCGALPVASADDPALQDLRNTFKKPYLQVGAVIQAVGDVVFDRPPGAGTNGFNLSTARFQVRGELDGGYGYFLQTDFAANPAVIDARVSLAISPAFAVDAGLFKTPFSAEFLIPAPSIDFVNRSQMVSALAPGREVGVAFRGDLSGIGYRLGAFNGNGRQGIGGNDDDELLYVGRLSTRRTTQEGAWEVGAHGAFSDDPARERTLFGADARVTHGRWLVSAEVLGGQIDPDDGAATDPLGYQATAGYMIVPDRHQVLARWDALDLDDGSGNQRFVVLGYNFWPNGAFEWQVNYLIPVQRGDVGDHQVLLNFQVAF